MKGDRILKCKYSGNQCLKFSKQYHFMNFPSTFYLLVQTVLHFHYSLFCGFWICKIHDETKLRNVNKFYLTKFVPIKIKEKIYVRILFL